MEKLIPPSPSSIEQWYRSQCNGDWEHQWGVQIETSITLDGGSK